MDLSMNRQIVRKKLHIRNLNSLDLTTKLNNSKSKALINKPMKGSLTKITKKLLATKEQQQD